MTIQCTNKTTILALLTCLSVTGFWRLKILLNRTTLEAVVLAGGGAVGAGAPTRRRRRPTTSPNISTQNRSSDGPCIVLFHRRRRIGWMIHLTTVFLSSYPTWHRTTQYLVHFKRVLYHLSVIGIARTGSLSYSLEYRATRVSSQVKYYRTHFLGTWNSICLVLPVGD